MTTTGALLMEENASFSGMISGGGRGTFVGTPLYVAPEMLECNLSGPFTDLWALGCIIYQCLIGEVPFRANQDYQVFQMISERKMVFPNYLPVEAIDLIDRIMQLDPFSRLGAGELGTETDYEHLKSHPFFKGVNFKRLPSQSPPIPFERFKAAMHTIKQGDTTSAQAAVAVVTLVEKSFGTDS
jgi:serine/threonine protein kinase